MPVWNVPLRSDAIWIDERSFHFLKMMEYLARSLHFVQVYLYDVVIHACRIDKHVEHVRQAIGIADESGLKMKIRKWRVWKGESGASRSCR